MGIVIDANVLACVFNDNHSEYKEFLPIRNWVSSGKGFYIFGGEKYKAELLKSGFTKLFRLLKDSGKALAINDNLVDEYEKDVILKISDNKCDDPHIVALLAVSRCFLLASHDARSFDYIKDRTLYPKGMKVVKIYQKREHANLLVEVSLTKIKNTV